MKYALTRGDTVAPIRYMIHRRPMWNERAHMEDVSATRGECTVFRIAKPPPRLLKTAANRTDSAV